MTASDVLRALESTWPAAGCHRLGPWILRDGQGGGQRVSAATLADADWTRDDIGRAATAMRAMGQTPLFMVTPDCAQLDAELHRQAYRLHDPVTIYAGSCHALAEPAPDPLTGFAHWPPLAITVDLWQAAGIGQARRAVMDRVALPKAAILGRSGDRPAGVAFVSVAGVIAALHALEIAPDFRRKGAGQAVVRHAAYWAAEKGATQMVLAVTSANRPARALYERLGLNPVGEYHYRVA